MLSEVSRKKQFKQSCYYCGLPYSSHEHAPPQQLFKGFTCNKVKVPSCDKHNTEKSGSDNAVIKAMLIALDTVAQKYPPKGDAAKAILLAKDYFYQVKNQVKNISKFTGYPSLTYVEAPVQMENWMRQLTAALIYSAIKKYDPKNDFDNATVFSPTWVKGTSTKEGLEIATALETQQLQEEGVKQNNWQSGWASGKIDYPTGIYNFKVTFNYIEEVVFRHQFFDSLVWYVAVRTSKKSREKMLQKVSSAIGGIV
jgi:hypothetical protein